MHVGIANMSHTCRKHTGARTESLGMLAAQGDSSQWMTHGFVKCHRAAKHLKALVTSVTTKQKMKTPPSHRSTESAACGPCEALSLQACRPERSGIVPDCRRHNGGGIRHATLRLGGRRRVTRFQRSAESRRINTSKPKPWGYGIWIAETGRYLSPKRLREHQCTNVGF